jgi:hypothetical protein
MKTCSCGRDFFAVYLFQDEPKRVGYCSECNKFMPLTETGDVYIPSLPLIPAKNPLNDKKFYLFFKRMPYGIFFAAYRNRELSVHNGTYIPACPQCYELFYDFDATIEEIAEFFEIDFPQEIRIFRKKGNLFDVMIGEDIISVDKNFCTHVAGTYQRLSNFYKMITIVVKNAGRIV